MKNKLFFKKSISMLFWSFALLLILFSGNGYGQVNISAGNTITQNFDGIGSTATATLPTGWKMENVVGARNVATAYASVANTQTGFATSSSGALSSSATNGRYNFAGATSTDRAIGGLSSGSGSQSVNMYMQLTNNGLSSISNFTISYDAERYRNGSNTAGFSIRFYYSTTGAANSWVEVPTLAASFAANADNNGSITNPSQTISLSNVALSQALAASGSIYLAWSYSVSSTSTTSNAQALGIDNVVITANASSVSPSITSSLTASATVGTALTSYTITASNTPTSFNATSLPSGLSFSSPSISGTPTAAGTFNTTITASNSGGTDSKTLVFTIAKGTSSITATGTTSYTYTASAQGPASASVSGSTSAVTGP
jgi:hypothetical protein